MNQPMPQPRVEALEARHARIEQEIVRESSAPLPDDISISRLKREKLHVRDSLSGH